ncbi:MAG: Heparinase family protein [Haloplasmataceae bacterium]|jgi:hypothetical protein|nr:Heparinase family protein [Haloplasmataceae bacterium]
MGKYVFINQDIEILREEIKGVRLPFLKRLLEQCELYKTIKLSMEHPSKSTTFMGIACANLALAYLLTKQDQYLNEAKRWIFTIVGYKKWGNAHLVNVDLSASWIMFGLSLAYDWLKENFNEEERLLVLNKLILQSEIMYDYKIVNEGEGWPTQYWQNHNWINLTGLATAGYALQDEYEGAKKWIEEAKNNFSLVYDYLPEDGSDYEGVVYWRYGVMWLFIYAHLIKVEEGMDYFKINHFLKNTFYYRLYQAVPNLEEIVNIGDCHDRRSGHSTAIYYKVAAEYQNGHAQYLANLVRNEFLFREQYESHVKPGILSEAMFELLWYNPQIEEKHFSDLPFVKFFPDLGLIVVRSSWDKDALHLSFKSGHPGGKKQWEKLWKLYNEKSYNCFGLSHQHADNNAFILHGYGAYLAIDEGYNREVKTLEHNVVIIDDKGYPVENVNDVLTQSAFKLLNDNPSFNPTTDFISSIDLFMNEANITAFKGNASRMYDRSLNLEQFTRTFLYTGKEYFIILDELRSKDEHKYTWMMHTDTLGKNVKPGVYDYTNGLASMNLTNLFPDNAKYSQTETYVKAVMTTQEPDNYREILMNTLKIENEIKSNSVNFLNILTPRHFYETEKFEIIKISNKDTIGVIVKGKDFKDIYLYSHSNNIEYENIKANAIWVLCQFEWDKVCKVACHEVTYLSIENKVIVNESGKTNLIKEV